MALNADGDLLFTDPESHKVWMLEPGTRVLSAVAGAGESGSSPDGTPALEANVDKPFGIAVGAEGRIFFSERGGHRVRAIEPDGTLVTVAGTGDFFFGGDGGPATEAGLDGPAGLALTAGVLYIADSGNDRLRAVDLSTGIINTLAGDGGQGFAGDDGPALEARMNQPLFVTVSADGETLFISDTGNNRVRAVDLATGTISTFAGTGGVEFSGDLLDAGATSLRNPGGLASSLFDLLFIADSDHHIVWRAALRL